MNFSVKLFAGIRERIGTDQLVVSLDEPCTVLTLRAAMIEMHPDVAGVIASAAFAADQVYVSDAFVLHPEMEIACIPPVSGG